jgi:hypothetical protein
MFTAHCYNTAQIDVVTKYGVPSKQSKLGNAPDFIETFMWN